jgi:5-enolpyruvylshikimate-3-phosphate synthase
MVAPFSLQRARDMKLPPVFAIRPLRRPPRAVVRLPGSKSVTNRALLLSAMARGRSVLRGALWSDDTQVMVESLRRLGFEIRVSTRAGEPSNCDIEVEGGGGNSGFVCRQRGNGGAVFVGVRCDRAGQLSY